MKGEYDPPDLYARKLFPFRLMVSVVPFDDYKATSTGPGAYVVPTVVCSYVCGYVCSYVCSYVWCCVSVSCLCVCVCVCGCVHGNSPVGLHCTGWRNHCDAPRTPCVARSKCARRRSCFPPRLLVDMCGA